jgi:hypothetical protein
MSVATLPASSGIAAVPAARNELIVLVNDTGATIVLADVPVLCWLVDQTGAMSSAPVILWPLTPLWATIELETRHLTPGLAGAARVAATMCDESFRGGFSELLDHLAAVAGKAVKGGELVNGTLIAAFGSWLSAKHGGRTFSAVGP